MDQVTTVCRRMKCEQWKSIICECHLSGMTVTARCKESGICEQTYYRNLKKFRTETLESVLVSLVDSDDSRLHLKSFKYRLLLCERELP